MAQDRSLEELRISFQDSQTDNHEPISAHKHFTFKSQLVEYLQQDTVVNSIESRAKT